MTSHGRMRALIAAAGLAVATFLTGAGAAHAAEPAPANGVAETALAQNTVPADAAAEAAASATGALVAPVPRPAPSGHLGAARGSVPITPDLDARLERAGSVPVGTNPAAPAPTVPLGVAPSSPSHARAPPAGVIV